HPTSGQVLTYHGTRWINGSAGDYQPAAANLDTWSGIAPTAGVAAWIATPNSTNLLTAMSGFTSGTGSLVFNSSPLITDNAVISILSTKTVETAGSGPFGIFANALTSGAAVYLAADHLTTGRMIDVFITGTGAGNGYGARISNTRSGGSSNNFALELTAS